MKQWFNSLKVWQQISIVIVVSGVLCGLASWSDQRTFQNQREAERQFRIEQINRRTDRKLAERTRWMDEDAALEAEACRQNRCGDYGDGTNVSAKPNHKHKKH